MTTSLLDLAVRPQNAPRCLVLAESDRARTGSSVAVLLIDPSTASPYWPLALAAYQRIWAGYKAHAPLVRTTALLAEVAETFAAEPALLERPDLVAAFATVEDGELAAWALPTALVLVRQGEELVELGPSGFATVPATGSISRGGEGRGFWQGGIEVLPGTSVCLVERATGARLGWWRLRHALGAASGEEILAELGLADEAAVAARVIRSPFQSPRSPFRANAPTIPSEPIESRFTAGLTSGEEPRISATRAPEPRIPEPRIPEPRAPEPRIPEPGMPEPWTPETRAQQTRTSEPQLPKPRQSEPHFPEPHVAEPRLSELHLSDPHPPEPQMEDHALAGEREPQLMLRAARRPRQSSQLSWLGGLRHSAAPPDSPDPAFPEEAPADAPALFQGADAQSAAGTLFALGSESQSASIEDSGTSPAGGGLSGVLLPGRRRAQLEHGGKRLRDSLLSWSADMLDMLGATGGMGHGASGEGSGERTLVRRALAWTVLGASAIAVLAVFLVAGRLLMGPRPEGDQLSDLGIPAAKAPSSESHSGAGAVPAEPSFAGASWSRRFPQAITSSPLVHGDRLIVGCRDGNLYALALADGSERWRLAAGSGIGSSPAAAGSLVVVGTYGGDVIAVDPATGREQWRTASGGKVVSSAAFVARAGIVAIGSYDRHIYGLAVKDGAVRWKVKTNGVVWASPAVAGDRVLVGSHDGALYCLDGETGEVAWRAETGGPISSTAAVWHDRVVVGSADHHIHAFELADGERLWSHGAGSAVGGSVVMAEDLVIAGTDAGELLVLDAKDGTRRYRVRTGGAVKSRPAVSDGRVWFTSYDRKLRVVDLASGDPLWSFGASGALYSSPALLGRTAFFGSMDGTVYAATWAVGKQAKL